MAAVQVLFTPGCAGCDAAKAVVARVLEDYPGLDWEEVDLAERPELAARYSLLSVPAVVVGGELAFTGVPKEEALRARVEALSRRGEGDG